MVEGGGPERSARVTVTLLFFTVIQESTEKRAASLFDLVCPISRNIICKMTLVIMIEEETHVFLQCEALEAVRINTDSLTHHHVNIQRQQQCHNLNPHDMSYGGY